ncbi:MAG: exosome complex RNA-binding protein Rrp4 [Candidatus Woesearchaeota archaeon]|jgi:exosome complex component RRP4|nr:exosome complex RNA-binding protein Rrp4 [Candidatus Woesearchaeota archaeon]MDP7180460.1 exosome complex RNA-binding protein Rrp4 [Candidatus Woesearchaeota archaeon]MDP7457356.1 exosome complex RNA-binding protein Rrp4 [Candidatus Woesearchaeota archaeon]
MTNEVLVKDKDIVVPGELLAEGMGNLPGQGTYRDGEKILAARLGLVQVDGRTIKLKQLAGRYLPKTGDTIICKVFEVNFSGWRVETNSAYPAMLSLKDATSSFIQRGADLTQFYDIGDNVVCQVTNVTSQNLVDVSMKGPGLRKLAGGRIIEVNTNKVPRIIGKQGSMIQMIKEATKCNITVGQNGLVWIDGDIDGEIVAVDVIKKIEEEAHQSGLTDRIKEYLSKVKVK